MKTYARIEADIVVELFETDGDISELFHPSLFWVEVTDPSGKIGWRYEGDAFLPPLPVDPSPPSESDIARQQISEIESTITNRRLREAMLSTTGKAWLSDRDAEIAALRAKIV